MFQALSVLAKDSRHIWSHKKKIWRLILIRSFLNVNHALSRLIHNQKKKKVSSLYRNQKTSFIVSEFFFFSVQFSPPLPHGTQEQRWRRSPPSDFHIHRTGTSIDSIPDLIVWWSTNIQEIQYSNIQLPPLQTFQSTPTSTTSLNVRS